MCILLSCYNNFLLQTNDSKKKIVKLVIFFFFFFEGKGKKLEIVKYITYVWINMVMWVNN